jgi:cytoskeletal protein CcmA (bactofilin family)
MIKKILRAGLVLAVTAPLFAFGAYTKSGDEVSVRRDQMVSDDAYLAGGTVNAVGTITGDLVTAGGNLFISGTMSQDVIAAGGAMQISGSVGDDLRVAGGSVSISGTVGDDVVVAGGQVTIVSGAVITGDLIVTGGQVKIDGVCKGMIDARGGEVTINGTVDKDVLIQAERVIVGENAIVNGKLTYTSFRQAEVSAAAQLKGGVVHTQTSWYAW